LYINAPKLLWHKAVVEAMSWHEEDSAKYVTFPSPFKTFATCEECSPRIHSPTLAVTVFRFYVVDRNTGELVHIYETPAAFCFHNINAWEEDDGTAAQCASSS
jgi:carotenoid cleavage dioxygenase-like enzyme